MSIEMIGIQQQTNTAGLYAIANPPALSYGSDPCKILWTNTTMPSHLPNYFSSKKLSQFPSSPEPHRIREEVLTRYVFFICRMEVGWQCAKYGD